MYLCEIHELGITVVEDLAKDTKADCFSFVAPVPMLFPSLASQFKRKTIKHKHIQETATAHGDMIPLLSMINSSYGTPMFKN